MCLTISNHGKFETVILLLIVFSSIKLVLDTYMKGVPKDDIKIIVSDYFDMIFTVAFTGETTVKSIAQGFILDKGSYMRESWNQLDCFIVITSIIDLALTGVDLPIIKILRLLRILRPLRFISHNSSMKNIVIALM